MNCRIGSGINLCTPFHFINYPKTPQYMKEFVIKVNSIPAGVQVAIIVYDGFLEGMQDILLPAFQSLGSTRFQEAQHFQKYCMIGWKLYAAVESLGAINLSRV
ncbi:hypothetical protein DFA_03830 [Cavenderia fasciculata]|uniref:ILEI/PANDER domain-containing protein n=1 Tax=Cavenderia fasciculata TaxID=261658 RepID=F4Q0I5_CACFS|nr:uncharacterized protein DFA_03830 [Cavenderia fasciculata]EGG18336.1 hypothetical protein DFA_03830 [Cavenderia fasciculata]|eukprot:XP_004366240.1 hypothetical protein DFA_03830 [Cavenderia fasciculata]